MVSAGSPENSSNRQALLRKLMRQRGLGPATDAGVKPRGGSGAVPATDQQTGLWFLDQLSPGLAEYNMPCSSWLTGPLDVDALEYALGCLVERHGALRLRFRLEGAGPVLDVAPFEGLQLSVHDLTEVGIEAAKQAALRLAAEEAAQPYDLAEGPVFRVRLLRLSADLHALLLNVHHITADGWSMGVFLRELQQLYVARCAGDDTRLSELPIDYLDAAAWQHERLQGERLEGLVEFWRRALADVEEVKLPLTHERPRRSSGRGAHHPISLGPALHTDVVEFGKAQAATPFVVLLAAFRVFLHSYSGQEDLVVGAPLAGRTQTELEPLVGYFVNLLPFRASLAGNPTFTQIVQQEGRLALSVSNHQELPFTRLVRELDLTRRDGVNPVYQVALNVLGVAHAPPAFGYGFGDFLEISQPLGEVTMSPMGLEAGASKLDLILVLWDLDTGFEGVWEYDVDLFDEDTIKEMTERFKRIVTLLVADPSTRLSDISP